MNNQTEINRYPNRRLYDRNQKKYVTLRDVEEMILAGQTVRVRDSKSDEDITKIVLIQILVERHPERLDLFPPAFLQEVLRADQMTLDWLSLYFRNLKLMMKSFSGSVDANSIPGFGLWQSMMPNATNPPNTGDQNSSTAETNDASSPAADAPHATSQDVNRELAAKVLELERRLAQLEGAAD
ncbi:MAG: polyhydroxyalkanoate synthesis regulator DNA-binding domain-containing protein [Pirellulaceae bacterium]